MLMQCVFQGRVKFFLYDQHFHWLLLFVLSFRVIRLSNGLTALLISDVHSKTSASQDEDQDKGKSYLIILI